MKLTQITVNDNEIKANSDGKYIFTMPENDVTVDADFEFSLKKILMITILFQQMRNF